VTDITARKAVEAALRASGTNTARAMTKTGSASSKAGKTHPEKAKAGGKHPK
jgi:hypothetical protein